MSYVVDFSKTPKSILLGLINSENNSTLTEDMFDFLPLAEPTQPGFDTHVPMQWHTTDSMIGLVHIHYNRIDIGTLFSLTGISLKEVNLTTDAGGNIVFDDLFFAELSRRYNVVVTAADFEFTQNAEGVYVFKAKANNLAYKGEHLVSIESSLESRVQATILDGFMVIDGDDIGLVLVTKYVDQYGYTIGTDSTKASADMITYGIDCTSFKDLLEIQEDGEYTPHSQILPALTPYPALPELPADYNNWPFESVDVTFTTLQELTTGDAQPSWHLDYIGANRFSVLPELDDWLRDPVEANHWDYKSQNRLFFATEIIRDGNIVKPDTDTPMWTSLTWSGVGSAYAFTNYHANWLVQAGSQFIEDQSLLVGATLNGFHGDVILNLLQDQYNGGTVADTLALVFHTDEDYDTRTTTAYLVKNPLDVSPTIIYTGSLSGHTFENTSGFNVEVILDDEVDEDDYVVTASIRTIIRVDDVVVFDKTLIGDDVDLLGRTTPMVIGVGAWKYPNASFELISFTTSGKGYGHTPMPKHNAWVSATTSEYGDVVGISSTYTSVNNHDGYDPTFEPADYTTDEQGVLYNIPGPACIMTANIRTGFNGYLVRNYQGVPATTEFLPTTYFNTDAHDQRVRLIIASTPDGVRQIVASIDPFNYEGYGCFSLLYINSGVITKLGDDMFGWTGGQPLSELTNMSVQWGRSDKNYMAMFSINGEPAGMITPGLDFINQQLDDTSWLATSYVGMGAINVPGISFGNLVATVYDLPTAGGNFKYHADLVAKLAEYGVPAFANTTPANPAYQLPTTAFDASNHARQNLILVNTVESDAMYGRLMLHYDGTIPTTSTGE